MSERACVEIEMCRGRPASGFNCDCNMFAKEDATEPSPTGGNSLSVLTWRVIPENPGGAPWSPELKLDGDTDDATDADFPRCCCFLVGPNGSMLRISLLSQCTDAPLFLTNSTSCEMQVVPCDATYLIIPLQHRVHVLTCKPKSVSLPSHVGSERVSSFKAQKRVSLNNRRVEDADSILFSFC
jgi:hypothetical protein